MTDLRGKLHQKPGDYSVHVNESPDQPGIVLAILKDDELQTWMILPPRSIPLTIRLMLVHWLKNSLRRHFGLFKNYSRFGSNQTAD